MYITGLRRAEGGVRSTAYKSCFSTKGNLSEYRPIWWFFDSDRADYESHYNVVHSDCYTKYGFRRTGCAGCPYSKTLSEDLIRIQQFEPKLYSAVNNVFKDAYDYTCQYQAFKQKMDALKTTK